MGGAQKNVNDIQQRFDVELICSYKELEDDDLVNIEEFFFPTLENNCSVCYPIFTSSGHSFLMMVAP